MSTAKRRVFNREFKLYAVQRYMGGASAAKICAELQIRPGHLAKWCAQFRRAGPEGLRQAGRPRLVPGLVDDLDSIAKAMRVKDLAAACKRIAELECKVGQQQVELDFFRQALRRVGEARRPSDGPGVRASTPLSRR
jgi:transposase